MLRTRLMFGTLLAVGVGVLLYLDRFGSPQFPGLFIIAMGIGFLATEELLGLIPTKMRPERKLAVGAVLFVLASNWFPMFFEFDPWKTMIVAVAGCLLLGFGWEMATYRGPGGCGERLSTLMFAVAYLGVLPSFLVKLRWLPAHSDVALALVIFVPKCGDIGAYFTGRIFGRTRFAPLLSPKKTREGIIGGTVTAMATAIGLSFLAPIFRGGVMEAAAFGFVIGWFGIWGDLAESMLKREANAKDASARVPGFGGVLDVIDSVIFAAPVAFLWLSR